MESYHLGVKPSVDISDGVLALRIAEAAKRSLKSGLPENLQ
jgi:myo-inositol 2-dehydrogenase/D-chiro-inositol 1-dehydrogenase